jgi:hypothetical protein
MIFSTARASEKRFHETSMILPSISISPKDVYDCHGHKNKVSNSAVPLGPETPEPIQALEKYFRKN